VVSPPIEGDEDIGNQENIPHLHISQECIENVILESPSNKYRNAYLQIKSSKRFRGNCKEIF
jgi:hypothetical protein